MDVDRHLRDVITVDHLPELGIVGIQQRRTGGDVDGLVHRTDFEREVECDLLRHRDTNVLSFGPLESGVIDDDFIIARIQEWHLVVSILVGRGGNGYVRVRIHYLDGSARNYGAA